MKHSQKIMVISLAGLSWSWLMISHEWIGHGALAYLLGGDLKSINAMYLYADLNQLSFWEVKLVKAGGTLVNLMTAFLAFLYLKRGSENSFWRQYLSYLMLLMHCFQGGAYMAFGRFIHPGMDWAMILEGLPYWKFWGGIELALGCVIILLGFGVGYWYFPRFVVKKEAVISQRFWLLGMPLLTATLVSLMASFLMPATDRIMMLKGAFGNSFLFMSGFLILMLMPMHCHVFPTTFRGRDMDYSLFALASGVTLFYLFVMSPGISF